jgi:hypothetical protein
MPAADYYLYVVDIFINNEAARALIGLVAGVGSNLDRADIIWIVARSHPRFALMTEAIALWPMIPSHPNLLQESPGPLLP